MAAPAAAAVEKKTKALNPKHLILLPLMAVLTAAVVVTAVFVVLRPARIYFSVTNASSSEQPSGDGGSTTQLNLTLAANNSSPRTWVDYHGLFVDVKNTMGQVHDSTRAKTNTTATKGSRVLLRQPARNVMTILASVDLMQGVWEDELPGNAPSKPFAVIVTAMVRFRVGFARTHMYNIKVTCSPVSFVPSNPKSTKGAKQISAAAAAPAPLSQVVHCV